MTRKRALAAVLRRRLSSSARAREGSEGVGEEADAAGWEGKGGKVADGGFVVDGLVVGW